MAKTSTELPATRDDVIADLAIATGAGQLKTGTRSRRKRVPKYHRLKRIEEERGTAALYPHAVRSG